MFAPIRLFAAAWIAAVGTACADPAGMSGPSPSSDQPGASAATRTVEAFAFIRGDTRIEDVVAALGEPDTDVGSGLHVYVYRLSDGTDVIIGSPDASEIWYVRHGSTTLFERQSGR